MTERIQKCTACGGNRICVAMQHGRLVNDNGDQKPVDTSKIKTKDETIEECPLRESLEVEDNNLELGS